MNGINNNYSSMTKENIEKTCLNDIKKIVGEEVVEDKVRNNDVLLLPVKHVDDELFAREDQTPFLMYCKKNYTNISFDIISDPKIKQIFFRSETIWLPEIYIVKDIVLPIVLSIISAYIYNYMQRQKTDKTFVDVYVIKKNKKNGKEIRYHYNGDANKFNEFVEKVKEL